MKSYTECNPLTFLINEKRKIKKLYAGNFVVPENQKPSVGHLWRD